MSHERQPHSVPQWLGYIRQHGPSDGPYPTDNSDLIHPESYKDPLDSKPERAALASIIAIRAYQGAKKMLRPYEMTLSWPPSAAIHRPRDLIAKSKLIGVTFTKAMALSLLNDEQHLTSLPHDNPKAAVYLRLKEITQPALNQLPPEEYVDTGTGIIVHNASSVFTDVFGGVTALPYNMDSLLRRTAILYIDQSGQIPETQQMLSIAGNSYETFIKPLASMHKADEPLLASLEQQRIDSAHDAGVAELQSDALGLMPEALALIRAQQQQQKNNRSKTTRCAFLVSADQVQEFLDEPAEFTDPLKDAFDLHMKLLAA